MIEMIGHYICKTLCTRSCCIYSIDDAFKLQEAIYLLLRVMHYLGSNQFYWIVNEKTQPNINDQNKCFLYFVTVKSKIINIFHYGFIWCTSYFCWRRLKPDWQGRWGKKLHLDFQLLHMRPKFSWTKGDIFSRPKPVHELIADLIGLISL